MTDWTSLNREDFDADHVPALFDLEPGQVPPTDPANTATLF